MTEELFTSETLVNIYQSMLYSIVPWEPDISPMKIITSKPIFSTNTFVQLMINNIYQFSGFRTIKILMLFKKNKDCFFLYAVFLVTGKWNLFFSKNCVTVVDASVIPVINYIFMYHNRKNSNSEYLSCHYHIQNETGDLQVSCYKDIDHFPGS